MLKPQRGKTEQDTSHAFCQLSSTSGPHSKPKGVERPRKKLLHHPETFKVENVGCPDSGVKYLST